MKKLNKIDKIIIVFFMFMGTFDIFIAIALKNFTYIMCALALFDLAIMQYCSAMLLKVKDQLIEAQKKHIQLLKQHIEIQNNVIKICVKIIKKPMKMDGEL